MNKILLSLLCILLVASFALTGCSNSPGNSGDTTVMPDDTSTAPGDTTVTPSETTANSSDTTVEPNGTTENSDDTGNKPNNTTKPDSSDTTVPTPGDTTDPEDEYNKNASTGLEFKSNGDGTCCVVGIGSCSDTELVIPKRSPEGDLVTDIGTEAFKDCVSVTTVTIPNSVRGIGKSAFANTAYYNDESNWENGVLYIGKYLIEAKAEVPKIYSIKEGTISVADFAFENCPDLVNVTIPKSILYVGYKALYNIEFIFEGTQEQFNSLLVPLRKRVNETVQIKITEKPTYRVNEKPITKFPNAAESGKIEIGKSYNYYDLILMENPSFDMNGILDWNYDHEYIKEFAVFALVDATVDEITGLVFISNENDTCRVKGTVGYVITELSIPEFSPNGDRVTEISSSAFAGCTDLTSIVVPYSVTSIGDNAFSNCTGLTGLHIGNITSIGTGMFSGCTGLTGITIPNNVTSIGDYAFSDCTGLTNITIPDSVTSIGERTFENCANYNYGEPAGLTSIHIGTGLISIGPGAFFNCGNLEGVYINDISAWCNIYFYDATANPLCYGEKLYLDEKLITDLSITNEVTKIGDYTFRHCRSLTSINIPDSVTCIGEEAFLGCYNLTNVRIGNGVTSIRDCAFEDCRRLTSITIPNSVTSIGGEAFVGCRSLTSVTIPNSVTDIGSLAFDDCTELTSISISNSVAHIGDYAFSGTAYYNDESNWENGVLYIDKHLIEVKEDICGAYDIKEDTLTIADGAFSHCSGLTSITIPNSITSIGYYEFSYCTGLTNITIPDSVTSIGDFAFEGCTGLTSITIPDSVTSIGDYAFADCSALTSITIPDSVASIGICAFYGCTSLTSIDIPDGVKIIGDSAFQNCDGLTSINIPDSVTSIGGDAFYGTAYYDNEFNWENGVLYIGKHLIKAKKDISDIYNIKGGTLTIANSAFSSCTGLRSVTIPDSVTSIGDYAFSNCYGLTSIIIPDSVTSIGYCAFCYCSSLTSITIPDSVTNIGNETFCDCNSLMNIIISNSVTSIGGRAFYSCDGLTSITFNGTKAEWGAIEKGSDWNGWTGDYTVHCTDGDIAKSDS